MPQETRVSTAIWLLLERQPYKLLACLNREVLYRVGQAGGSFCAAVPPGTMADFGIHIRVDMDVCSNGSRVFKVKFVEPWPSHLMSS